MSASALLYNSKELIFHFLEKFMSLNYRKGVPRTVNSLARSALKVQGAVYVEGLRSETVLNGNAWELTRHAEHRVLLIPPP